MPPATEIQADPIGAEQASRFPRLFSPLAVGPLTLKNRIFVTGHMTMMVTGGVPSEAQAAYYAARARGGVAMIVTEAAAVHETGLRGGSVLSAAGDACIPGYARIVEANLFTGDPRHRFEAVGRGSLVAAIESGHMPDHKLLEVGAGALRVGW